MESPVSFNEEELEYISDIVWSYRDMCEGMLTLEYDFIQGILDKLNTMLGVS